MKDNLVVIFEYPLVRGISDGIVAFICYKDVEHWQVEVRTVQGRQEDCGSGNQDLKKLRCCEDSMAECTNVGGRKVRNKADDTILGEMVNLHCQTVNETMKKSTNICSYIWAVMKWNFKDAFLKQRILYTRVSKLKWKIENISDIPQNQTTSTKNGVPWRE